MGLGSLLVGAFVLPPHALCDSERWRSLHDDVAAGRVISLSQLLDGLEKDWQGQVMEVELDERHGKLIYEVEMLGPQGQMAKFTVLAADGSLQEVRGVNLGAMRRDASKPLPESASELGDVSPSDGESRQDRDAQANEDDDDLFGSDDDNASAEGAGAP